MLEVKLHMVWNEKKAEAGKIDVPSYLKAECMGEQAWSGTAESGTGGKYLSEMQVYSGESPDYK